MKLSNRFATATPDMQRELLEELWLETREEAPADWTPERIAWSERNLGFRAKLDAGAFADAALSMVPDGWIGGFDLSGSCTMRSTDEEWYSAEAATLPLAIGAAIAQAHGL